MLYPVTVGSLYIQTDQIIRMVFSTLTITMSDSSTQVVSAAQFKDIIAIVNAEANH
jgi:hypothetical protein